MADEAVTGNTRRLDGPFAVVVEDGCAGIVGDREKNKQSYGLKCDNYVGSWCLKRGREDTPEHPIKTGNIHSEIEGRLGTITWALKENRENPLRH